MPCDESAELLGTAVVVQINEPPRNSESVWTLGATGGIVGRERCDGKERGEHARNDDGSGCHDEITVPRGSRSTNQTRMDRRSLHRLRRGDPNRTPTSSTLENQDRLRTNEAAYSPRLTATTPRRNVYDDSS